MVLVIQFLLSGDIIYCLCDKDKAILLSKNCPFFLGNKRIYCFLDLCESVTFSRFFCGLFSGFA